MTATTAGSLLSALVGKMKEFPPAPLRCSPAGSPSPGWHLHLCLLLCGLWQLLVAGGQIPRRGLAHPSSAAACPSREQSLVPLCRFVLFRPSRR